MSNRKIPKQSVKSYSQSQEGNGGAKSGYVRNRGAFAGFWIEALVVQDDTEKRTVDFNLTVVANET